jgi:hypothetical protein
VWAAAEAQGKALYEELLQVHGESVQGRVHANNHFQHVLKPFLALKAA